MRTLAAYSEFSGARTIAGHDVPQMIGQVAQIELSHGSKTWAQLHAAMPLQGFGKDLNRNGLWQGPTLEEGETYRALLDPRRFYESLAALVEAKFVVDRRNTSSHAKVIFREDG